MTTQTPLYLSDFIKYGESILLNHGISNAKKEIEWLCENKLNIYNVFLTKEKKKVDLKEKKIILDFINRRKKQEPFQYIIEKAPFYNEDFYVNSNVLIPRPETEIIIEIIKSQTFDKGLDIGTGSGNLAITLSLQKICKNILAIDVSNKALSVAKTNIQRFKTSNVTLKCLDFFKNEINKKFDLIVCNPPYISSNDYSQLPKMLKDYEPQIALTDLSDGYKFYRHIAERFDFLINKAGMMLIEIGLENTKPHINELFTSKGYITKWYKDYNNNYRIVKIKK